MNTHIKKIIFYGQQYGQLFENRIKKYGYNDLETALKNEIPSIFHIDNDASLLEKCVKIDALSLWDENPQLYILTIFKK